MEGRRRGAACDAAPFRSCCEVAKGVFMRMNSGRGAVLGLAMLISGAGAVAAQAAPAANDEVVQAIKRMGSDDAQERADAAARLRDLGADAQVATAALVKLLGDQTPTQPRIERAL